MSRFSHPPGLRLEFKSKALLTCAVAVVLGLVLCACGGSDSGKTVATIGKGTKITRPVLNHWMEVVLGGDYRAALVALAPTGLVSDPANYNRCVSAAESIVPKVAGKPKLTRAQMLVKCRQLNTAIKEQALGYVISVLWSSEEAAELGLHIPTEGEISKGMNSLINSQFNGPANFRKVIAGQRRSLADVRFLIKRNLLEDEIRARLTAKAERLQGGARRNLYRLVLQNNAKLQAKTSCSPGYNAWECKEYSGHEAKPPPAVLLEDFSKGIA